MYLPSESPIRLLTTLQTIPTRLTTPRATPEKTQESQAQLLLQYRILTNKSEPIDPLPKTRDVLLFIEHLLSVTYLLTTKHMFVCANICRLAVCMSVQLYTFVHS